MKKTLLILGSLLLALGLGLSWQGRAMGGADTATVHLFGRTWTSSALFSGRGLYSVGISEATPEPGEAAGEYAVAGMDQVVEDTAAYLAPTAEGEMVPLERFEGVEIVLNLGDVTVTTGEDYGISLNYWGDGYRLEGWVDQEDGVLHIQSSGNAIQLMTDDYGCQVTVYVPEEQELNNVRVDIDLGSADLRGVTVRELDVDLDLGELRGENLTVLSHLGAELDCGSADLHGDFAEMVEISADLGSVTLDLTGPADQYSWELEGSMGSATVDGSKQSLMDGPVSGGSGPRTIHADADMGSIEVNFSCVRETSTERRR